MTKRSAVLLFAMLMPALASAQAMDSLRKAAPGLAKVVPPSPTPAGFVADVAHVLSVTALDSVNAAIHEVQDNGLGDIAIAIVPDIRQYTPVEVGLAIYRVWRVGRVAAIGDVQRSIGVLILMVPNELAPDHRGHCWITTGTGSEGLITDATAGAICRGDIQPKMIKRDYSAAALAGVHAISARMSADAANGTGANTLPDNETGARLKLEPVVSRVPGTDAPSPWSVVAWTFGSIGVVGAGATGGLWWRRNRKRKCPKCGRTMERLSETEDDAALNSTQQVEERITQRQIRAATYSASGVDENTYKCEACRATRKERVTLPMLVQSTASSSSSSGSSSFGGSDCSSSSSFGGSGSSSGGGGGSDY